MTKFLFSEIENAFMYIASAMYGMNSEFLPEAEEEFREATMHYETKAPGVGVAFVAEVRRAVRWIIENPYAAVAIGGGIRSKILNSFP
jgi:hypothetical protein